MLSIGDTGSFLMSLNGDIYLFENKGFYFYRFLVLQNGDRFSDQTVKKACPYSVFLSNSLNSLVN